MFGRLLRLFLWGLENAVNDEFVGMGNEWIITFQPALASPFDSEVNDYPRRIAWSPHKAKMRLRDEDISTRNIRGLSTLSDTYGFIIVHIVQVVGHNALC